jgi:hypothetical protein
MGMMMICCGMAVKRMGILGVSVRKVKALAVKMETVTLVKRDIIVRAFCIKCVKLIVKYFFLADILFMGDRLRFG